MKSILLKVLLGLVLLITVLLGIGWWVGAAVGVAPAEPRDPVSGARPTFDGDTSTDAVHRILFGDLHVHTNFSMDAEIFNTPLMKDMGSLTPTDACDFARYCSALDFWSINDHAEGLAPWQWQQTKEAIRACNAVTDPGAPDMVSFLGWEWSHGGADIASHYGHKNVIFKDTADNAVPTRPIASGENDIWRAIADVPAPLRGLVVLWMSDFDLDAYRDLLVHMQTVAAMESCPAGDVRDLAENCYEWANTPDELFNKLDQWGFDALVIPHGLSWGNTNPRGADFDVQISQHDARYQRLVEIYSGHGNSEVYRDMPIVKAGDTECPAPMNGYTNCCWQAGEIIRTRCETNGGVDCDDRAAAARTHYMAAINGGILMQRNARSVVPETHPDDWGACDQLVNGFQPAAEYQPRQAAQYLLTLGSDDKRFRTGFIGSSDNHVARGGGSYKEKQRFLMTDAKERSGKPFPAGNSAADEPQPVQRGIGTSGGASGDAFFFTGGLVAVHSRDRTRESIWEALHSKRVYGTSGPRIQLWFEMISESGENLPMGAGAVVTGNPTFRVRAAGSLKQKPGCPAYALRALGKQRTQSLCGGECFNPGDEAWDIDRIEVIRVRPRTSPDETPSQLIDDPWRRFDCDGAGDTCVVEFTDEAFMAGGREVAYYVRAIQETTDAIQGDPLRCEFDADGRCVRTNYCVGVDPTEDCLSPTQHRAWSSPIYVRQAPGS